MGAIIQWKCGNSIISKEMRRDRREDKLSSVWTISDGNVYAYCTGVLGNNVIFYVNPLNKDSIWNSDMQTSRRDPWKSDIFITICKVIPIKWNARRNAGRQSLAISYYTLQFSLGMLIGWKYKRPWKQHVYLLGWPRRIQYRANVGATHQINFNLRTGSNRVY